MKFLILALFLPHFCFGFGPKTLDLNGAKVYKAVLEGKLVKPEDQIWKNSVIIKSNQNLCSGVIIDSKVILTAAHCLDDVDHESLKVYFGYSPEQYSFQRTYIRVNKAEVRPEYKLFEQQKVSDTSDLPDYINYNLQSFIDFLKVQQKRQGYMFM